jgi:hypothetical protein
MTTLTVSKHVGVLRNKQVLINISCICWLNTIETVNPFVCGAGFA